MRRGRITSTVGLLLGILIVIPSGPVASATGFTGGDHRTFDPAAAGSAVFAFGGAPTLGSLDGTSINAPIVGMAATPDGGGYWLVGSDGGVFTFGDAGFYGSMGGVHLNRPVVGMAGTADGRGYWLVASDGGIFTFGDAKFYGSMGGVNLNQPVVGMAGTSDGRGYWEVASDGGIFTFGDARFYGSMGAVRLNKPVVGMAANSVDGRGYWEVASDGGIFTFGDARFYGSMGAVVLNKPVVGMAGASTARGYWMVASDGGIFTFGDAKFYGSLGGQQLAQPVVGMASSAGRGYWLVEGQMAQSPFTPALVASLNQRAGLLTAAVEDLHTGQVYEYNPGLALVTASIVKVQILGTLLAEAQNAHRSLTPQEQSLAVAMIQISDNNAATTLYQAVGGAPAVLSFDQSIGMTGSTPVPSWGVSTTTATDQLILLNAFVHSNPVLNDGSRAYGLVLLNHVEPSQVFGVSAGVAPGALQAVKTGRLPAIGVINGIGWVNGQGRNYLIAVLAQAQPSDQYGLDAISAISMAAWASLGS